MIKTIKPILTESFYKKKKEKKKRKLIHLFMCMKNGLNKFLAPLPRTEKFLNGSTRSLAYTDHIIQFGLNKFWLHSRELKSS